MDDRERLQSTFDQAAQLYQGARPQYPEDLFNRLMAVTGLRSGDHVVEVGPGPGKATLPLARRGLRITAIEPGPALAAEARSNLSGYPVEVVESRFEDWAGPPGAFAAVVAATAWHWVDPQVRYRSAARALRPGGHLVIWGAQHVFPVDGDPFFAELQEVYDAIGQTLPKDARWPGPGELADQTAEIEASGQFDIVSVDHFDWTVDYTAETYIDLLRTFSNHIAMAPVDRERLFAEIRQRVAQRPSRTVRRGWGAALHIARKKRQRSSPRPTTGDDAVEVGLSSPGVAPCSASVGAGTARIRRRRNCGSPSASKYIAAAAARASAPVSPTNNASSLSNIA